MAYLAHSETIGGDVGVITPGLFQSKARRADEDATLSALEWSVVALAQRDALSTLRTPGRIASALGVLFGERPNPKLADERLEALRRIAILSRHHGYNTPPSALREFVAAGFTLDHFELVVRSVQADRAKRKTIR